MKQGFNWFVVVGFGLSGKVRKNPYDAWNSYYQQGCKTYDYQRPYHNETSKNAHSPVLCMATTKRAAKDADISCEQGVVGNGMWRRVLEEDVETLRERFSDIYAEIFDDPF